MTRHKPKASGEKIGAWERRIENQSKSQNKRTKMGTKGTTSKIGMGRTGLTDVMALRASDVQRLVGPLRTMVSEQKCA